jgi:hypothetical protein
MAVVIHSSSYALGNLHIGAPLNIYKDVVNGILARSKKTDSRPNFQPFFMEYIKRDLDGVWGGRSCWIIQSALDGN